MNGAPARTRSHYQAILELLRERGSQGVLGSELYARPELYGRSPRNRISELRRDGFMIEGRPHGAADWHYWLIRDNAGISTTAVPPKQAASEPPKKEIPWAERRGVTGLPLFDAAVRP